MLEITQVCGGDVIGMIDEKHDRWGSVAECRRIVEARPLSLMDRWRDGRDGVAEHLVQSTRRQPLSVRVTDTACRGKKLVEVGATQRRNDDGGNVLEMRVEPAGFGEKRARVTVGGRH